MFEKYLNSFSKLHTDKNRTHWSALTCDQAPHKPFLLLSVLDLVAQGSITDNLIKPSFELVEIFNLYWTTIMPAGSRGLISYPFYHMRTEDFWELLPNPGYKDQPGLTISSMTKLREIFAGARIDYDLFHIICNPDTREQLRALLINTYFAPEIHPVLVEQGMVNYEANRYSEELLKGAKEEGKHWEKIRESEKAGKARDQGFRKAIVFLYQHRCALCGIRMLTPEGHTVVEAAHIKPWNKSHDDMPTNGMALCRLCHWSFDEGLMSVGKKYEVLVSKRVQVEQNLPGHILTLRDRSIFTPEEDKFWPAQKNLDFHRRNYFRA